jgi:hypothetical protein
VKRRNFITAALAAIPVPFIATKAVAKPVEAKGVEWALQQYADPAGGIHRTLNIYVFEGGRVDIPEGCAINTMNISGGRVSVGERREQLKLWNPQTTLRLSNASPSPAERAV